MDWKTLDFRLEDFGLEDFGLEGWRTLDNTGQPKEQYLLASERRFPASIEREAVTHSNTSVNIFTRRLKCLPRAKKECGNVFFEHRKNVTTSLKWANRSLFTDRQCPTLHGDSSFNERYTLRSKVRQSKV